LGFQSFQKQLGFRGLLYASFNKGENFMSEGKFLFDLKGNGWTEGGLPPSHTLGLTKPSDFVQITPDEGLIPHFRLVCKKKNPDEIIVQQMFGSAHMELRRIALKPATPKNGSKGDQLAGIWPAMRRAHQRHYTPA